MGRNRRYSALYGFSVFVLSSAIVFSFGLHSIQLEHSHPGHHSGKGETAHGDLLNIDEYVHGTEQKFFIVMLLLTFFAFSLTLASQLLQVSPRTSVSVNDVHAQGRTWSHGIDYLVILFARGVLHPKLH